MGGGHKPGNNWKKFGTDPKSINEGKGGKKKDANEKKRKPYASGGMKNRDGEKTDDQKKSLDKMKFIVILLNIKP